MSDKPVNNIENNSESLNENKEMTSAEKIHQKISELKNENVEETENTEGKGTDEEDKSLKEIETVSIESEISENKEDEEKSAESLPENTETEKTAISEESKNNKEPEDSEITEKESEPEDFSEFSEEQIIERFSTLLKDDYKPFFEGIYKKINDAFNQIIEKQREIKKKAFTEDGSKAEDFEPVKSETEITYKDLVQKFRDKKETFEIRLNEEKKKNLELKYRITDEISELVNKGESFSKIFNKFKELQKKWNTIGLVPKNDLKPLMEKYNQNVQKFYEFVEVNKELRELDFKKNYEIKISLCEKAEKLILESNHNIANKELQTLHKKWKETGSVANEVREELWARFQSATIKINKNYGQYLDEIKEQQQKNLESKRFLVEKAEELAQNKYESHIDWKNASDKVIEIQKLWRKIGYVPKEYNNKIYTQFKEACDLFFERIRAYYEETEKDRDDNLQKKTDLCIRAESLQDSTEWIKTSDIYKNIQSEWKKIGPVPKKQSDEIWKRFRKACNAFFDKKKEYYKNRRSAEKENLIKKQELIEKIENLEFSDNQDDNLKLLKEFQNSFISTGYVPFEKKDEIYEKFHKAVDKQYEKLNISKDKLDEIRFTENIEALKKSPDSDFLIQKEMGKIQNQIDKLNDDIKVWENNIGFFSSSSKSDSLLKNVKIKIESAKAKVASLNNKMKELDKTQQ